MQYTLQMPVGLCVAMTCSGAAASLTSLPSPSRCQQAYSGPALPVLMDTGTDDEFLKTQVGRL